MVGGNAARAFATRLQEVNRRPNNKFNKCSTIENMCKLRECLQQFSWLSFIAALFLAWMLSNLPQVDGGRFNHYSNPTIGTLSYFTHLTIVSLAGWSAQCWRKHNSGSIQTPDGEFKRPFGILCTYQCFLWFPPM